jgi:DNA-binding winged helix-turn-helix (wHTH) protein
MSNGSPPIYEFGPFRLDPQERLLSREGQAVALTPKAFDTLLALVENRGRALEKGVLMKRLWPDAVVEEATLAQNVSTSARFWEIPPVAESISRRFRSADTGSSPTFAN